MEMQIETYDVAETLEKEVYQIDEQSAALVEELGLKGQKELTNEKGEIRPYNILTKDQAFICAVLFPECTAIDAYSVGPIPYRIMKEAKNAKEHCGTLYIIHEAPAIVKDPVLIGGKNIYSWSKELNKYDGAFLIARWGEALLPWDEMMEKAKKLFIASSTNTMRIIKSEADRAIALLAEGILPSNKTFEPDSLIEKMPFNA